MDLTFDISHQQLTRTDKEFVANLSDNYLRLCFTFKTTDWDNLDKYVLVKHKAGTTRLELVDGKVTLPEGLLRESRVLFTVYGVDDPDTPTIRITTNGVKISLNRSGYVDEYSGVLDIITQYTVDEIWESIGTKADSTAMTTALAGKSDVGHTHTKSDITDFGHTHTKSEVTDFAHNHDDRYYTENEVNTELAGKVDKVNGKGLSTNDYTDADKTIVDNVTDNINRKVDKVTGKGLSANDFTDNYKHILDTFDGDFSDIINDHLDDVIDELTNDTFYTKTEVTALLNAFKDNLDNRVVFKADKTVIQVGDTVSFTCRPLIDGFPVGSGETVSLYEVFTPTGVLGASSDTVESGSTVDLIVKVKDSDGNLVSLDGATVKIYEVTE